MRHAGGAAGGGARAAPAAAAAGGGCGICTPSCWSATRERRAATYRIHVLVYAAGEDTCPRTQDHSSGSVRPAPRSPQACPD